MAQFDIKKIFSNIFNKNKDAQETPQPESPKTKTLQEIIFDQCRENVNPNYIKEQSDNIYFNLIDDLRKNGTSAAFFEEVEATDFEKSYPSRIASELSKALSEKASGKLQQYFPMHLFKEDIEYFLNLVCVKNFEKFFILHKNNLMK